MEQNQSESDQIQTDPEKPIENVKESSLQDHALESESSTPLQVPEEKEHPPSEVQLTEDQPSKEKVPDEKEHPPPEVQLIEDQPSKEKVPEEKDSSPSEVKLIEDQSFSEQKQDLKLTIEESCENQNKTENKTLIQNPSDMKSEIPISLPSQVIDEKKQNIEMTTSKPEEKFEEITSELKVKHLVIAEDDNKTIQTETPKSPIENKCCHFDFGNFLMAFILFILITVCSFGLFYYWSEVSESSITKVSVELSKKASYRMDTITSNFFADPFIFVRLMQAYSNHEDIDYDSINDGTSINDKLLTDLLQNFQVENIYIGLSTGAFIKASQTSISWRTQASDTLFEYPISNGIRNIGLPLIDISTFDTLTQDFYVGGSTELRISTTTIDTVNRILTVFSPLYYDSTFIGVVGSDIKLDNIGYKLQKVTSTKNGLSFIISESGVLVASSDIQYNSDIGTQASSSDNQKIANAASYFSENVFVNQTIDSVKINEFFFCSYTPLQWIPGAAWVMVTVQPISDTHEQIEIAYITTLVLAIISSLFAFIFLVCVGVIVPIITSGSLEKTEKNKKLIRQKIAIAASISTPKSATPKSATPKSEEEIQDDVVFSFANKYFGHWIYPILYLCLILIILTFITELQIWASISSSEVNKITETIVNESSYDVYDQIIDIMKFPQMVNTLLHQQFLRGDISFSHNASTPYNETKTTERFLIDSINSFTDHDGNYLFDMIYWGEASSSYFFGTSIVGGKVFLDYKDSFSDNCYRTFSPTENGYRNFSDITWESCTYDIKVRPWFKLAQEKGDYTWTNPYLYVGGTEFGITAVYPVYSQYNSSELIAVLAVDKNLGATSQFLSYIKEKSNNNIEIFLMDEEYWMVSNSDNELSITIDGQMMRLKATSSNNEAFKNAALYFTGPTSNPRINLLPSSGVIVLKRTIFDPITAAGYISDNKGMKLISVTLLGKEYYTGEIDEQNIISTQIMIACLIIFVVCLSTLLNMVKKQLNTIKLKNVDKFQHRILDELGEEEIENETLELCLSEVEKFFKETNDSIMKKYKVSKQELSIEYLSCIKNDYNIFLYCIFYKNGYLWLYKFIKSKWYNYILHIVVFTYIFLTFARPISQEQMTNDGIALWIKFTELAFLIFLVFNWFIIIFIKKVKANDYDEHSFINQRITQKHDILFDIFYIGSCFIIALDWLAVLIGNVSFEFYFPFRSLLLLVINQNIFSSAKLFIQTLYQARWVLVLYFSIIIVSSVFSFSLFRVSVNTNETANSFRTFLQAFITTSSSISTTDNFDDTVYNTIEQFHWFMLFFWVFFMIICLFFVLAMLIAYFQARFSEERNKIIKLDRDLERIAILASFKCIDSDDNRYLEHTEFQNFLETFNEINSGQNISNQIYNKVADFTKDDDDDEKKVEESKDENPNIKTPSSTLSSPADINFRLFNADAEQTKIDLRSFVVNAELLYIMFRQPSVYKLFCNIDWRIYVTGDKIRTIKLIIVFLNIWLITLYGIFDENYLDITLFAFLCIFVFEVLFSIWAFGFLEYFNYKNYHIDINNRGFVNIAEFLIMIVSVGLWLLAQIYAGALESGFGFSEVPWLRVVYAFPTLRLFSLIRGTRILVVSLLTIIPRFWSLICLLIFVEFIFGTVGVNLFANQFYYIIEEPPNASWDSLPISFLSNFELLVGNNWTDTMYAAVSVMGWGSSVFFLVYLLFISMIFTNLFLGIILDGLNTVLTDFQVADEIKEKELLEEKPLEDVEQTLVIARERAFAKIR